jgi:hypothetical protein
MAQLVWLPVHAFLGLICIKAVIINSNASDIMISISGYQIWSIDVYLSMPWENEVKVCDLIDYRAAKLERVIVR